MVRFDEFLKLCKDKGLSSISLQNAIGCSASQIWQWKHDQRVYIDSNGFIIRISTIRDNVNLMSLIK
jgi:transcriptional regulator with XRE-family HTH domain